jgi:AraC family transcriptional regulator, transcriptional activator of pobA
MRTSTNSIPVCNLEMITGSGHSFDILDNQTSRTVFDCLNTLHRSNYYAIYWCVADGKKIVVDHQEIDLSSHIPIVIKPGSILQSDLATIDHGYIVFFEEDFFSLRYNNNVLHDFEILQSEGPIVSPHSFKDKASWERLFLLMHSTYHSNEAHCLHVMRSYLNIILNELNREQREECPTHELNSGKQLMRQFEQLIEREYSQHKLPSYYAEKLHITPSYLNKITREIKGTTAGEVIRKRVMIEAQRHLHYSSKTVNEISDLLGFDNVSYFVTSFKKHCGISPEKFRKREH